MISRSSPLITGSSWNTSPNSKTCFPPNGSRRLRLYTRRIRSTASIISARTIDISSIMTNSTCSNSFRWGLVYLKNSWIRPRCRLRLGSSGSNGWKGSLKKLCKVLPPALMAAMPVGASTICFSWCSCRYTSGKSIYPSPLFR